ncbi:MAG: hypothetical protein OXC93_00785, partial [Rhodospirillaceae bacterium]|nr:hypothetical protein [Rhodospirillaceae bacterium]
MTPPQSKRETHALARAAPSTGLDAVHGEFLVEAEVGCIQRARLDITSVIDPPSGKVMTVLPPVPEMIGITVMVEIASRVVTIAAHPGIDHIVAATPMDL